MPHIVFVSSALLCSALPGGWCARLAPEDCGGLVPLCSAVSLAALQRKALATAPVRSVGLQRRCLGRHGQRLGGG